MKSLKTILFVSLCIVFISSCGDNSKSSEKAADVYFSSTDNVINNNDRAVVYESEIRRYVQSLGKTLATNSGMFQNIKGCDYQDKAIIFKIETNSDFINPEAIKRNHDIEKKELLAKFKYQIWKGDTTFRNALKKWVEMGISGEMQYTGSKNKDKQASVYLSTDDFKEVAEFTGDPTKEVLEAQVNALNIHMPVKADYCTIMDKMSISDGYLTYDYTVIEDQVPMSYFKENISLIEENLRQKLFEQCDDDLMHQAKSQGLGYRYRYSGDITGKTYSIKISNAELK